MKSLMLLPVLILTGCALFEPKVKLRTETQNVYKPILYCPAPTTTEIPRLAIEDITQDTSAGEVAKRYKASILQLRGYIELLETTLDQYDSTNAAYKEVEEKFIKELKRGDFDINTDVIEPSG